MSSNLDQVEVEVLLYGDGVPDRISCRAATTAAGTLASSFENGDTIDGVVLATGDRLLIKNQASGAENGIYIVQATGAPERAADLAVDAAANYKSVGVREGTANAGTTWRFSNLPGSDVVGTDALTTQKISVMLPVTATDNAIARWDGISAIQDSGITIDDSDNMAGLGYLELADIAAPANPGAGLGRLYKKTGDDGIFWKPDGAGPEVDLTAAGSTRVTYTIFPMAAVATSGSYTAIGHFTWLDSRYSGYTSGTMVFYATIGGWDLDVRLQDVTNVATLGSATISSSGATSLAITNPSGDAQVELQVRRSGGPGSSPSITGVSLEFDN